MTTKPYLLTQKALKVAANCHLDEQYGRVDCDHCPIGYYCQDIGTAYQIELLEWLIAKWKRMTQSPDVVAFVMHLESILKELKEAKQ